MITNEIKLLVIFMATITIGCGPLKNLGPSTYIIEPIEKSDYAKLNGTYLDIQDTVFGNTVQLPKRGIDVNNRRLLDRLFIFYPNGANDDGTIVNIKFCSNREAIVSAHLSGSVVFTKIIHGKFKNGYFYLRPKVLIIPFFPVFYRHNFERVRLGKMGDDIVVDHSFLWMGFALIDGGSSHGRVTSVYKQAKY
jgi:hypothetical protein